MAYASYPADYSRKFCDESLEACDAKYNLLVIEHNSHFYVPTRHLFTNYTKCVTHNREFIPEIYFCSDCVRESNKLVDMFKDLNAIRKLRELIATTEKDVYFHQDDIELLMRYRPENP